MIKVSIIIPTYRDWHRLSLCLEALTQQTFPSDSFEIIVINNEPNDEQPHNFFMPDNCKIVQESKSGSYAARNAGLRIAQGEVIGFTDSDCLPSSIWIETASKILSENKNIMRIGGEIQVFYKKRKPNIYELYDLIYAFPQEGYVQQGFAVTGNMFSRKIVFDDIGFFNDTMISGGDNEWGTRASQKGYPIIFSTEAIIKHPARSSLSELRKKEIRVRNGIKQLTTTSNNIVFKKNQRISRLLKLSAYYFYQVRSKRPDLNVIKVLIIVLLRHYLLFLRHRKLI